MPMFEGEDFHGWIYRVERYFAVNDLIVSRQLHYIWREML